MLSSELFSIELISSVMEECFTDGLNVKGYWDYTAVVEVIPRSTEDFDSESWRYYGEFVCQELHEFLRILCISFTIGLHGIDRVPMRKGDCSPHFVDLPRWKVLML